MLYTAFVIILSVATTHAFWLMSINNPLTIERLDPIESAGSISAHTHFVAGGSGFCANSNTEMLRKSKCTSVPIAEDKSNYWVPQLYFQWNNGSVSSVDGNMIIYYLFDADSQVVAFPDNMRMRSGDPKLRSYDPNSKAQQAVSFVCLNYAQGSTKETRLPIGKQCPEGIRSQVNFPKCWDGKNLDSPDHTSHVAFPSESADAGVCNDTRYPKTIPRIFVELYWDSGSWYKHVNQAQNPTQPFVFSQGDATGYGFHADFMMGWDKGVLERAIAPDGCVCHEFGDMQCCVDKDIFTRKEDHCRITTTFQETVLGTLPKLPGNNPVGSINDGPTFSPLPVDTSPPRAGPVVEYIGDSDVPPKLAHRRGCSLRARRKL